MCYDQNPKDNKGLYACIRAHNMFHCTLAEIITEWDEGRGNMELQESSPMGPMCKMSCKRGDCKCDDGPTCHFGHSAKDHQEKN